MQNPYRKFFPTYKNNKIVYLDNAATTQICEPSLKAINEYYLKYRSNVHRGLYDIAEKATATFEAARISAAEFLNSDPKEIIFTSGTTQGLNFLCSALTPRLGPRDNVVITKLEHHSNLVPWQQAAKHYGFELRYIEIDSDFRLDLNSAKKLIDENTKIVSFALISNVLGTINPAEELIGLAKKFKALTIVDAAQAAAHIPIDVRKLNCDFLVLSGHKIYGPNGIGVLYGKKVLLDEHLEPVVFGGEMVSEVTFQGASWAPLPHKFEAGTPNVADAIGLGAAFEFIKKIGWKKIIAHERLLTKYALKQLSPLVKIFGPTTDKDRAGVISFTINGIHPHDIADLINQRKVAVRAGAHCAEPLHREFKIPGTARASFGLYNTTEEIDTLTDAIIFAKKIFKV
jgi:cysteine desulfurase/selenocysteine lyase